MITIRKSGDRGHANHGWLNTFHTFSFADYYDPRHMGFRSLRVINEDRVQPGKGFGTHPHHDMEILTYIIDGALEHRDSLGTGAVIYPGELQRMSAGRGVTHSEFNPSKTESVHLLQIWIEPSKTGLDPSYEQIALPKDKLAKLHLAAASHPSKSSETLLINQDAKLYVAHLPAEKKVEFEVNNGRHQWIQVARGAVAVNGIELNSGDGAAISNESLLTITTQSKHPKTEILLFDLS